MISNLCQVVRRARKAAGLTLDDVARRAAISSVAKLESFEIGYGKLSPDELARVNRVIEEAQQKRLVPLSSLVNAVPPPDERRLYRRRAGLTQQQLARRMGVSQSLVSLFERGQGRASTEFKKRWLAVIEEAARPNPAAELGVQVRENSVLHQQLAALRKTVANLKQQLTNSESMLLNQEEIAALQHGMIETLKGELKRLTTPEEFSRIEQMEGVGY